MVYVFFSSKPMDIFSRFPQIPIFLRKTLIFKQLWTCKTIFPSLDFGSPNFLSIAHRPIVIKFGMCVLLINTYGDFLSAYQNSNFFLKNYIEPSPTQPCKGGHMPQQSYISHCRVGHFRHLFLHCSHV